MLMLAQHNFSLSKALFSMSHTDYPIVAVSDMAKYLQYFVLICLLIIHGILLFVTKKKYAKIQKKRIQQRNLYQSRKRQDLVCLMMDI